MARKRPKKHCEICNLTDKKILHYHHIIPQCDPRCTDTNKNIAILCPTCHSKVHTGEYIIIGVYKTTIGETSFFYKEGEQPPLPKYHWQVIDNPFVIRKEIK